MKMRMMVMAMAAVLGISSFASAQISSAPSPYLQMEMVPEPVARASMAYPSDNCGPTVSASYSGRSSVLGSMLIRCGCASQPGCGNFQSTKTFIFGSCRQFFNAGSDCGVRGGCFGSGVGCWGVGGCGGYDPCSKGGNSFLNR